MADNPFANTEFEDSWQAGFTAGFLLPERDHTPPTPLAPEFHDSYRQGVAVGRNEHRGFRVPPGGVLPEQHQSWGALGAIGVFAARQLLGKAPLGVRLAVFGAVGIWGPERLPFFDEAARDDLLRLRNQLIETGMITDNVDLFMAACDQRGHGGGDDELTSQGYWHGTVFLSFEEADAEAKAHDHPDNVRVIHFQSASPDMLEILE